MKHLFLGSAFLCGCWLIYLSLSGHPIVAGNFVGETGFVVGYLLWKEYIESSRAK